MKKPLTEAQIRAKLRAHFRQVRKEGYAPPFNAGGRRAWSWAPILRALGDHAASLVR